MSVLSSLRHLVPAILMMVASTTSLACSSASAPTTDNGDEINGNNMGLSLSYNEPNGTLHATVRDRLGTGEVLKLRVRRGRLSSSDPSTVDCLSLPDAPKLPSAGSATVIYQGPTVDAMLLASVYNQEWIASHLSPEMIDQLQRDNNDSLVEACIVAGDIVRSRVRTTVAFVWDRSDPLLAEAFRQITRASLGAEQLELE